MSCGGRKAKVPVFEIVEVFIVVIIVNCRDTKSSVKIRSRTSVLPKPQMM